MKSIAVKKLCVIAFALVLSAQVTGGVMAMRPHRAAFATLPNPVLYATGQELYEQEGKKLVRYRYAVENFAEYPLDFFAPAPELPPCGNNTKASRTWVDLYDQSGKRLNGFCAFGKPDDLNSIWFSIEQGAVPPSWVYIELNDRKTATKYKSNLAETGL